MEISCNQLLGRLLLGKSFTHVGLADATLNHVEKPLVICCNVANPLEPGFLEVCRQLVQIIDRHTVALNEFDPLETYVLRDGLPRIHVPKAHRVVAI